MIIRYYINAFWVRGPLVGVYMIARVVVIRGQEPPLDLEVALPACPDICVGFGAKCPLCVKM